MRNINLTVLSILVIFCALDYARAGTPPEAPTGLTLSEVDGKVKVSWDHDSTGVKYAVEYRVCSAGHYDDPLNTASRSWLPYVLSNGTDKKNAELDVDCEAKIWVRVAAFNEFGQSDYTPFSNDSLLEIPYRLTNHFGLFPTDKGRFYFEYYYFDLSEWYLGNTLMHRIGTWDEAKKTWSYNPHFIHSVYEGNINSPQPWRYELYFTAQQAPKKKVQFGKGHVLKVQKDPKVPLDLSDPRTYKVEFIMDAVYREKEVPMPVDIAPTPVQIRFAASTQNATFIWNDNSRTETGHKLETRRSPDGSWVCVKKMEPFPGDDNTKWTDIPMEKGDCDIVYYRLGTTTPGITVTNPELAMMKADPGLYSDVLETWIPPLPPSELTVEKDVKPNHMKLSWKNNSTKATSVHIFATYDDPAAYNAAWHDFRTLEPGTTSYVDHPGRDNTKISYKVVAFNDKARESNLFMGGRMSLPSNTATIYVPVFSPETVNAYADDNAAWLDWDGRTYSATGVEIWRRKNDSAYEERAVYHYLFDPPLEDRKVEKGQTYYYKIRHFVIQGQGYVAAVSDWVESGPVTMPVRVPTPSLLKAVAGIDGPVNLQWLGGGPHKITGFEIMRKTAGESDYSVIASIAADGCENTPYYSYTDSMVEKGKGYYYRVRARYNDCLSEPSRAIGVNTLYVFDDFPPDASVLPACGISEPDEKFTISVNYTGATSICLVMRNPGDQENPNYNLDNAFAAFYDASTNMLYLIDEYLELIGGFAPGSENVIETRHGKMYCADTSIDTSGSVKFINFVISINRAFGGLKNVLIGQPSWTGSYINFLNKGQWTIGSVPVASYAGACPGTVSSRAGDWVTFTSTYYDKDGWDNMEWCALKVNDRCDSDSNCFAGFYAPASGTFHVAAERAGTGFAPVKDGKIETAFAILDLAGTKAVVTDANTLKIEWRVCFKEALAGERNIYMFVHDISKLGMIDGYAKASKWYILKSRLPQAGNIVPVPAGASSLPEEYVTFMTTFSDPDGVGDIARCMFMVRGDDTGTDNCFSGYYDTKNIRMHDDAGTGLAAKTNNVFENSYARLDMNNTKLIPVDATTFRIQWRVGFKEAFSGLKRLYAAVYDKANIDPYDPRALLEPVMWIDNGQWEILSNQAPEANSVEAMSQQESVSKVNKWVTFRAVYTDPDDVADIAQCRFRVNAVSESNVNCFDAYMDASGNFHMLDDSGTKDASKNNDFYENTYARLDLGSTKAEKTGFGMLAIEWRVCFKEAFVGHKRLYVSAVDKGGLGHGIWSDKGGWTVDPNQAPSAVSAVLMPQANSCKAEQWAVFKTIYRDYDGAEDLVKCGFRITENMDASAGGFDCYMDSAGALHMLSDDTSAGCDALLRDGIYENTYAKLDLNGSSATKINTYTLEIIWRVYIKSGMAGTNNVFMCVRDVDGEGQEYETITQIKVLADVPQAGLSINGGETISHSRMVKLDIISKDDEYNFSEVRYSNDKEIWSAWEQYTAQWSKLWVLPNGNGIKTVYAQVKDAGSGVEMPFISDTIELNYIKPLMAVDINGDLKDDIMGTFSQCGVWVYSSLNNIWEVFTPEPARYMAGGGKSIALEYDVKKDAAAGNDWMNGIWLRDQGGSWSHVTDVNSQGIAVGDLNGDGQNDVIGNFPEFGGLWAYYGGHGWTCLGLPSCRSMIVCDVDNNGYDDIVADFKEAYAHVWAVLYDAQGVKGYEHMAGVACEWLEAGYVKGDNEAEILGDFGGIGLWMWDYQEARKWQKISDADPQALVMADVDGDGDKDVIAGRIDGGIPVIEKFDPVQGLWTKWLEGIDCEYLHHAEMNLTNKDEVIMDIKTDESSANGIWVKYDDLDTSWHRASSNNAG